MMTEGTEIDRYKKVLLDTNILIHMARYNEQVSQDLDALTAGGHELCVCFQNFTEFWCVASRPASANGLGLNQQVLLQRLHQFRNTFIMLPDLPQTLDTWMRLCRKHEITGLRVHDARLAATALVNGVTHIMTRNSKDFSNFEELTVIEPQDQITDNSGKFI